MNAKSPQLYSPFAEHYVTMSELICHHLYSSFCADSPFSPSYRQNESTIFSSLHQPVHIPIEVKAYPRTAGFQWYFNTGTRWLPINASDNRFNITQHEMNSILTINKLELGLTGLYRVEVSNGIRSPKVYGFRVLPEGIRLRKISMLPDVYCVYVFL